MENTEIRNSPEIKRIGAEIQECAEEIAQLTARRNELNEQIRVALDHQGVLLAQQNNAITHAFRARISRIDPEYKRSTYQREVALDAPHKVLG